MDITFRIMLLIALALLTYFTIKFIFPLAGALLNFLVVVLNHLSFAFNSIG